MKATVPARVVTAEQHTFNTFADDQGREVPGGMARNLWITTGKDQPPSKVRVNKADPASLDAFEHLLAAEWLSDHVLVLDIQDGRAPVLLGIQLEAKTGR